MRHAILRIGGQRIQRPIRIIFQSRALSQVRRLQNSEASEQAVQTDDWLDEVGKSFQNAARPPPPSSDGDETLAGLGQQGETSHRKAAEHAMSSLGSKAKGPRKQYKEPRPAHSVFPSIGDRLDNSTSKMAQHLSKPVKYRINAGHLDPIFLRDSCTCKMCVDPSSGQKHVWTSDIPKDISIKTRADKGDVTKLTWKNDVGGFPPTHVTTLKHEDLYDTLLGQLERKHRTDFVWDRKTLLPHLYETSYHEYMASPGNQEQLRILASLRKTGLAFLFNVPESEESVVKIATQIGPLRNSFYGMTWDVRSVPKANNVAYTSGNLGFHCDLCYMKEPPRLQFLHCLRSAAEGGASLFTDAFKAVAEIARDDWAAFELLTTLKTPFHYVKEGRTYRQTKPFVELAVPVRELSREEDIVPFIECVNWSPMFQGNFNASDLLARAGQLEVWHRIANMFRDYVEREGKVYERYLEPGVCVLFDNRRVLHARTAFAAGDVGKERWLKGCYVDLEPYESALHAADRRGYLDAQGM